MSYIGATGLSKNDERFDTIEEEIDTNANYINNLVGIPDPIHLAIYGINVFNPSLYGLVERAEVNISQLQSAQSGTQTEITGIQDEITAIQGEITGIQGEISVIDGDLLFLNTFTLPAMVSATSAAAVLAGDAEIKANKSLGIWDEDGNNTYNMKSGNVGIGILPKGTLLNNKLEVNGNINIPTGSTFRINNLPLNYSHLAGTLPIAGIGTAGTLGGVKIGSGLSIDGITGVLTNNASTPYTLPITGTGTGGTLGGVKVDGTTISINASTGVISRTGNTILLNATTNGEYYGWTGLSSLLGRVGVNGQYSTGSLVEDIVLRSNGDVLLQSGIGNYAM
jgi:hypothetical protein